LGREVGKSIVLDYLQIQRQWEGENQYLLISYTFSRKKGEETIAIDTNQKGKREEKHPRLRPTRGDLPACCQSPERKKRRNRYRPRTNPERGK